VEITVAKNGQSRRIARSSPSGASPSAVPAPYQEGSSSRFCVQAKTHGIARSPSMPASPPGRRGGREPIASSASSSSGVKARKKSAKRGVCQTRSR
jgi:hypothetical protein